MGTRKKLAAIGALAAAGWMAAATPAMAYSGWDSQLGASGYGCYAYTTYSSTIVTPHIWQQAGNSTNLCTLEVDHVGYDAYGNVAYSQWWGPNTTTGPSSPVDGPNWYYGSWNGNGWMCVRIYVWDKNGDAGSNGNYREVC